MPHLAETFQQLLLKPPTGMVSKPAQLGKIGEADYYCYINIDCVEIF